MIDLVTPLGRPPLDTFSPTQVVRTAEPLPVGVWEIEGGAVFSFESATPNNPGPLGSLRYGLLPGVDIAAGAPGPARRMLGVRYAPIPALWSVDLGVDAPPPLGRQVAELGSTLELALPWFTPRLAPRIQYRLAGGSREGFRPVLLPRLDLGVESRLLKLVTLGIDADLGTGSPDADPPTVNLGARFRIAGNLGGALFAAATVPAGTWSAGALVAMRF